MGGCISFFSSPPPSTSGRSRSQSQSKSQSEKNPKLQISIYSLIPSLLPYKELFQYFFLTDTDLLQFYAIYKLIKDPNHEIIPENKLIRYFRLEDSLFAVKIFTQHKIQTIFDFILIIWHFCTIEKYVSCFLYDLYCQHNNNVQVLTIYQCDAMIREIFDKKYDKLSSIISLNRKLQHLSTNNLIHSWFFYEFTSQHSSLLSPCVILQKKIMDQLLGRRRWNKLIQARILRDRGQYKSFNEVMEELNLNPHAKKRHDKIRQRVRSQYQESSNNSPSLKTSPDKADSHSQSMESSSLSSNSNSNANSPSKSAFLVGWCRAVDQNFNLFDHRTVIVKPLPPVDVPDTIKSLHTYTSLAQSHSHHSHHSSRSAVVGGLSEVKYLTKSAQLTDTKKGQSHERNEKNNENNNSMILEDME